MINEVPFALVSELKGGLWDGALGKAWIAESVSTWSTARFASTGRTTRLLDLGAGSGTGWTRVLEHSPHLEVTLWDANPTWFRSSLKRQLPERLHYAASTQELRRQDFDVVTSLSVVEHVHDVEEHLRLLKQFLATDGVGVVLWDDGHFRPSVNLRQPIKSGVLAAKESTKWGLSALLGARVPPSHFQYPRSMETVQRAADAVGLRVITSTLVGLPGIKGALFLVPQPAIGQVMNAWLHLERDYLASIADSEDAVHEAESIFGSRLIVVTR